MKQMEEKPFESGKQCNFAQIILNLKKKIGLDATKRLVGTAVYKISRSQCRTSGYFFCNANFWAN